MKKLFSELSYKELAKVFENNEKLKTSVYDDFIENEMYFIGEQIDSIKQGLSDWSIGAYNHNYLKISDYRQFLNDVEDMQKDYEILNEDEEQLLEKAVAVTDAHYESEMYSNEYYELEEEMERLSNKVGDMIINHWENILNINNEDLAQYFVEFYSDSRMDSEDYYIDTDSYELFEQVNYVKSYR